ncbi:MAG: hypothetical protein ABI444_09750 [Candidatus Kapaibacterium sp.]|jgi:hypothetical protein
MGKLYELFFVAFFIWLLYRRLVHPFLRGIGAPSRPQPPPTARPNNAPPAQEQKPASTIDRTLVEDADYKDLD